jgi:hypothetical protein
MTGQSLNLLFSTTELLQYFAGTVAWDETGKTITSANIGTGFTAGETILVASADESGNNGTKTLSVVAAGVLTIEEDVVTDASDAITINQQVIGDWVRVDFYSRIVGAYSCSQNANLYADWSIDGGTNTILTQTTAISAGTPAAYAQEVIAPYVRYRLVNSGTDQTEVAVFLYAKPLT